MILPSSYEITLLLGIAVLLCLGSWPNLLKLTGPKGRFELFYFDFAIGAVLTGLGIAFTFGQMGPDLSFLDNLAIAGKRQLAWAALAGVVFNLGNMLLAGAISIAGIAAPSLLALGTAFVVSAVISFGFNASGQAMLVYGGAGAALAAVIVAAMSLASRVSSQAGPAEPTGRGSSRLKRPSAVKPIAVSLVAGLFLGGFYPLVTLSRAQGLEIGLLPYTIAVCFLIGVFVSTVILDVYFINLPIEGDPIDLGQYFRLPLAQHALGVIGGIVWAAGLVGSLLVPAATGEGALPPSLTFALLNGAPLLAALWGLLVWREYKGASGAAAGLALVSLLLLGAGVGLVARSLAG